MTSPRQRIIAVLATLFVVVTVNAIASPTTIGNILRPHRQAPSSFPDASSFNTSGLLGDNDGGVYISDGTNWSQICTLATGCGGSGGSSFDAGNTPLSTIYFNNVFDGGEQLGGFVFTRTSLVSTLNYYISSAGSGTTANFSIGSSGCTCPISCSASPGAYSAACTGTCSISGAMTYSMATGCTFSPSIYGNVTLVGSYSN